MKGGMAESQAGCTIWDDVSRDTFARFAEFAYMGDYSIPDLERVKRARKRKIVEPPMPDIQKSARDSIPVCEPEPEPSSVLIPVPEPVEEFVGLDYWRGLPVPERKKKPPKSKTGSNIEILLGTKREKYPECHSRIPAADFHALTFPLLVPRNNHDKACEPAATFDPERSYANVFLAHAALYVLADYKLIDSLKALALYKLHKTLCAFRVYDENAEDIVALARYAYSEEAGCGGLSEGNAGVRNLVCHYMATNALVLSFNDAFMELLGEGGQFVKDFFKYEVQRDIS